MSDIIDDVVIKRIEDACVAGDIDMLCRHLSDSYDRRVHRAVYEALGILGTPEAVYILMRFAVDPDTDAEDREYISRCIGSAMLTGTRA